MKKTYNKTNIYNCISLWWQLRTAVLDTNILKVYVGGALYCYQDRIDYGHNAIIFGFEI